MLPGLLQALLAFAAASSGALARPPECDDRHDNDGDGLVDYPQDPGCSGPEDYTEAGGVQDLSVQVRTDKEAYLSGEPVKIQVLVTNVGGETVSVEFSSSCQVFLTVTGMSASVSYDSRLHTSCSPIASSLSLGPQEAETYAFTWYQVDDAGQQVQDDAYFLAGYLGYPDYLIYGWTTIAIGADCSNGADDDGDGLVDYPQDPGCQGPADREEDDLFGQIQVELLTDQTVYLPGEYVLIDILISNVSEEPVTLEFPCFDTPSHVWFVVDTLEGRTVYSSQPSACLTAIGRITLQPGQTEPFYFAWAQVDLSGSAVAFPSEFRVRSVVFSFLPVPVASARILVGPACHDGLDNDLDGAVDHSDDTGCAGPSDNDETGPIFLRVEAGRLTWSAVPEARGYDVVRGSVLGLSAGAGHYAAAVLECLADDWPETSLPLAGAPMPGEGFWYLARTVHAGGTGSYDSDSLSQVGSRDASITGSPLACP